MQALKEELPGNPAVSSTGSFSTAFCSQKFWGLIFLALQLWTGRLDMGLTHLTPEISLLNFYLPYVGVALACSSFLHLRPFYQSGWMWFLNSVVVRLPFNLISDGSE